MKTIKADIVNKTFKRVYLLFGEEEYLVRLYKDSLKRAALGDSTDEMNYNHFTGQTLKLEELEELALTLPFFADRRVILVENSGLFGAADNGFADFLNQIPDSTVLIITEGVVDKRSKLLKTIKDIGYACEFTPLKPEELMQFVASQLMKANKRITRETCEYFINNVGGDMYNITSELDKLVSYLGQRDTVTRADIEAICTMQIENRIFEIVDALNRKDRTTALNIYYDLLALKESPLGLLRFMMKQYMRISAQVEMFSEGKSDIEISAALHIQDWLVRKNRSKFRGLKVASMKNAITLCAQAEEDIKMGRLSEQTGLEILLANLVSL